MNENNLFVFDEVFKVDISNTVSRLATTNHYSLKEFDAFPTHLASYFSRDFLQTWGPTITEGNTSILIYY